MALRRQELSVRDAPLVCDLAEKGQSAVERVSPPGCRLDVHRSKVIKWLAAPHCVYPLLPKLDVSVECMGGGWECVCDEVQGRHVAYHHPDLCVDVLASRLA